MLWTEQINQMSSPMKGSSFLCHREDFARLLRNGTLFLRGAIENLGLRNVSVNKEIAYQDFDYLKKYKNSKILIIGAGPSLEMGYEVSEYDYIWSCNSFYNNDKLKNIKIDLVTLGDETNLSDENLLRYIDENGTIVCFENKYTRPAEMKELKNKYPEKVFWAMTRYHSRIGSIPRLACIAISLGAKEIHFAGMDGYVPENQRDKYDCSVFERTKLPTGTIEDTSKEDEILRLYKEQYLAFWDYLLHDIGKHVIFKNLGHRHSCNLSTNVLSDQLGCEYEKYLYNPNGRNNDTRR